mmetsp:Transcript_98887/g.313925  ORF Transcript_98887/g.313925 Transcript_98887/m.313925 type:complete len:329 (-) Transcript_98887:52-1038(-)
MISLQNGGDPWMYTPSSERGWGSWQPSPPMTSRKDALVQRVKDWQKRSEGHKQSWYNFCTKLGSTNFDPDWFDETVLQEFLLQTEAGEMPMCGGKGKGGSYGGSCGSTWGPADDWSCWDAWWDPMMSSWGWGGGGMSMWDMMAMMWGMGCGKGWNSCSKGGKFGKGAMGGMGFMGGMGHMAGMGPMSSMGGMGAMGMGCTGGVGCMGCKGGKSGGPSTMDPSFFGGKPGDWICPGCWNVNYSHRDRCNVCGTAGRGEARLGMKPGDWICPKCGDLVFSTKAQCKMCRTPKPEEPAPDHTAATSPGSEAGPGSYGPLSGTGGMPRQSPY